ncbi:ABC transporter substrate-binding protein [Streptomyces sp. HUAS MG47]|uniref:ABC transporter substrate-binding protein n=1 Tax=Streptomyces solicamelliae TaxID=3231716 RepID=UPI0038781765
MGADASGWEFIDDRGAVLRLARRPRRVAAYVRAGAALLDLGVVPVAVYGSGHDDAGLDPVKAGGLAEAGVPYLGPGRLLTGGAGGALGAVRADLVVDVTYDGKSAYAIDEAVVDGLGVPLVALSVGSEVALPRILERFAGVAETLRDGAGASARAGGSVGAGGAELGAADVGAAEDAVRTVAGGAAVVALSPAGGEQVHVARPQAWPELARLRELGVRLVEPGPGVGTGWLTTDWESAALLGADVVLVDSRANAVRVGEGWEGCPAVWREAVRSARVVAWNPETPPSAGAFAGFFREVAAALA